MTLHLTQLLPDLKRGSARLKRSAGNSYQGACAVSREENKSGMLIKFHFLALKQSCEDHPVYFLFRTIVVTSGMVLNEICNHHNLSPHNRWFFSKQRSTELYKWKNYGRSLNISPGSPSLDFANKTEVIRVTQPFCNLIHNHDRSIPPKLSFF